MMRDQMPRPGVWARPLGLTEAARDVVVPAGRVSAGGLAGGQHGRGGATPGRDMSW